MSRQHKIRWRESDLKELKRVVNNVNAKLRRIEKKNPEYKPYLPKFSKSVMDETTGEEFIEFTDRLTVNQMKELIQTRADFKKEINALKRFSRRGSEQIVDMPDTHNNIKLTKWELSEMKRRLPRINKLRQERKEFIESLPVMDNGEETTYTVGDIGMGKQIVHEFSPQTLSTPSMRQNDVRWKFRAILKESQHSYYQASDEALRDNYIWSLTKNYFGDDLNPVLDKIQNMNIKEFLKVFYQNPGIFEWSYHDQEQYDSYLEKIYDIWSVEYSIDDIGFDYSVYDEV